MSHFIGLCLSLSLTVSLFLSVPMFLPFELYHSCFVFLSLCLSILSLYLSFTGSVCLHPFILLIFSIFASFSLPVFHCHLHYLSVDDYITVSPSLRLCLFVSVSLPLPFCAPGDYHFVYANFINSLCHSTYVSDCLQIYYPRPLSNLLSLTLTKCVSACPCLYIFSLSLSLFPCLSDSDAISLPLCLCLYDSDCLSFSSCLPLFLPFSVSASISLFLYLSVIFYDYLSVHVLISLFLSLCLSSIPLSICLLVSACISHCLFLYLYVDDYFTLSLCICSERPPFRVCLFISASLFL